MSRPPQPSFERPNGVRRHILYLIRMFLTIGYFQIFLHFVRNFFTRNSFSRMVFINIFVPNGLPTMVRRCLPTPIPRAFGNTLLCPLCQKLLARQNQVPADHPLGSDSFRHHDDLILLTRSAKFGCRICLRLLGWIATMKSKNRSYYLFAIRAQLRSTSVENNFELQFSLLNSLQPWELTEDNALHILKLQVFPPEG
jgi:hypothetical protein